MLGKLDIHMHKNEVRSPSLTIYFKKLKWLEDINPRPRTMKLLQENIGGTLQDIGMSKDFLSNTAKAQATEAKNGYMGSHQVKKTKGNVAKETK